MDPSDHSPVICEPAVSLLQITLDGQRGDMGGHNHLYHTRVFPTMNQFPNQYGGQKDPGTSPLLCEAERGSANFQSRFK